MKNYSTLKEQLQHIFEVAEQHEWEDDFTLCVVKAIVNVHEEVGV